MPYAGLPADQTAKLEACVRHVMAQGRDKASAIGICRSAMKMSSTYAFEPFSTLDGVLSGKPFKMLPIGKWYRGERTLDITPDRAQAIAANLKAGLPRFRVPINENHGEGLGKVGTVSDAEYLPDGADGPGLYATRYELTDAGKKLVADKRYDAVSPEMVWTLNDGAQYQDPTTGAYHDNVMVGLALTAVPFFGHDNVALFSAHTPADGTSQAVAALRAAIAVHTKHMASDAKPSAASAAEAMKFLQAALTALTGEGGAETEMNHVTKWEEFKAWIDNLLSRGTDTNREQTATDADRNEGDQDMINPITPEEFAALKAKADESAALKTKVEALEAKAGEADKFKAELVAMKTAADKFAAAFAAEQKARRLDAITAECERFRALPAKTADLAACLLALEEKAPEEFKFIKGLLSATDKALGQSALFAQMTDARGGNTDGEPETFDGAVEKVLKDEFKGDRAQYRAAMTRAEALHPDLFSVYKATVAGHRR